MNVCFIELKSVRKSFQKAEIWFERQSSNLKALQKIATEKKNNEQKRENLFAKIPQLR